MVMGGMGKNSNEFFDATPPPPLTGATLASLKSKSQFQDFWMIYPKRMNVSKAEIEITEALNDGALLDDILDGARRYANWVKHKGWCGDHKYISLPDNWIKGKRWLDAFEVSAKDKIKVEFEDDAEAKVKPTKKTAVKDAPRTAKSKAKVTPVKVPYHEKPEFKAAFDNFRARRQECIKNNNPECIDDRCPTCTSNWELVESFNKRRRN